MQAGLSLTWSQTPKTGFLMTRLKYHQFFSFSYSILNAPFNCQKANKLWKQIQSTESRRIGSWRHKTTYRNDLKFLDRQVWANSIDPWWSSLIRAYIVCYSVCIFQMNYCMVKPQCSHFRIITAFFGGVQNQNLSVYFENEPHDKTNKMSVRPAKIQISLGIRPVWSESLLALNG